MNSRLDKYKNIFNPTGCISEEQILKYHKKSLSHEEMHKIERHLLDCQLCSDALEGFAAHGNQETIIGEIKNEIHSRANPSKANLNFKTIAIAALLTISFGISFFIYKKINDSKKSENLVTNSESNQKPENKITDVKEESSLKDSINLEKNKGVIKQPETPQNNLIATLPEKKKEIQSKKEEKIIDIPAQPKLTEEIKSDQNDNSLSYSAEESSNIETRSNDVDTLSESPFTEMEPQNEISATSDESETQQTEKLELGKTYYAAPSMVKNKSDEPLTAKKAKERIFKDEATSITASETLTADSVAGSNIGVSTTYSENLFSTAMDKFNHKEYKEAAALFISMSPKNEESIYYAALSYYNIQEFKMSVKYFEIITKNKKSSFFEGSQWHLALSYIANNEINKAKKLLKLIIDEQGKYELEAQQQLEKMRE